MIIEDEIVWRGLAKFCPSNNLTTSYGPYPNPVKFTNSCAV